VRFGRTSVATPPTRLRRFGVASLVSDVAFNCASSSRRSARSLLRTAKPIFSSSIPGTISAVISVRAKSAPMGPKRVIGVAAHLAGRDSVEPKAERSARLDRVSPYRKAVIKCMTL
jgi:hypothetical protein